MPSKVPDNEPQRSGMIANLFHSVQSLTLSNVLIIALLVAIAIPSGFLYLFFTNSEFRKQWQSYVIRAPSAGVPCAMFTVSETRAGERTVLGTSFHVEGDLEYFIVARSFSPLTKEQLKEICTKVHLYTDVLEKNEAIPSQPP
jgi:hypothetical protein